MRTAWLCAVLSWLVAGGLALFVSAVLCAFATRANKPPIRIAVVVAGLVVIVPATALGAYMVGVGADDWFHPQVDPEAYLWLLLLTSWIPAVAGPLSGALMGWRWGRARHNG